VTSPTSFARSRATAESGSPRHGGPREHRAAERGEPLRRPAHDEHEHAEAERRLRDVDPQLTGAERLRLLDVGLAEVGSRLDRDRLGTAIAGAHDEHGGLGDDHRGDERDRQAP
jgi:hypothetical protein